MRFIYFGATKFSEEILISLIKNNYIPNAIFTIPEEFSISYSTGKVKNYNYSSLNSIALEYDIPIFFVDSIKGTRLSDYENILSELRPEVILVMGWYYKINKKIRNIAKYGAWGIHASLLPEYAGGAPLVWAIINGEKKTGVTLFRLDEGVDNGDIIAKKSFSIAVNDTIKEVYDKATKYSIEILIKSLKKIPNIKFTPQNQTILKVYPQRSPSDGKIDLDLPGQEMYNFIRAQAPPYPGAFILTVDNKKIIIEKARIEN